MAVNDKRYDLVESFNALALAGIKTPLKASSNSPNNNRNKYISVDNGESAFVGGFSPGLRRAQMDRPLPKPPQMPIPQHSRTMHYALAAPAPVPYLTIPHTPPSRPASASIAPTRKPTPPTPKRARAASSPPSPVSIKGSKDGVQCSGITKAGVRCSRIVKNGPPLSRTHPDSEIERYCYQHTKEILEPTGFYSHKTNEWVDFASWIPDYLQSDTQVALRSEMEKPHSQSDVPGYIYTFEIRDPDSSGTVQLKVGRAVNLVKRIDQWGKQCGSKEQVLRGWWPGSVEPDAGSLMKGRVKAGDKGAWCHRLERLVHLELADLAEYAPYLDPSFPNAPVQKSPGKKGNASPRRAGPRMQDKPCADCGTLHKEVFTFRRTERGRYKGKEWEMIVKPVIEKWGGFVEGLV